MNEFIKRREFLRLMALSSASFILPSPLQNQSILFDDSLSTISNDFFTLGFIGSTGRFWISQKSGNFSIINATVRVNTPSGKRALSETSYKHSADTQNIQDKLGAGQRLIIFSRDEKRELDFEIHFSLYNNLEIVIVEAISKNVSTRNLNIRSLEPVCAITEIGSSLSWNNPSKVLTNGAMYYDAGQIHNLGEPFLEPDPYGPTKGGKLNPDFIFPSENKIRSWWNIGFFKGYEDEGLVCGFVDNNQGLGQIIASKNGANNISLYSESVFSPGFELKPGDTIKSNRFMICISKNPYSSLETYSKVMGILNSGRVNSIINGWCSWFYTFDNVTEEEVIRNAEFISRNLKKYGLDYVQIDEGYQRYHGDWEGNEKFPHGMKWLADKIKSYGLKPGLWIAPYVVSELTEIFQKNPEWFLKDSDGQLLRVGPWPSIDSDWAKNENPKRYGLDVTHPEAAGWLYKLFDTAANNWGYEMFKIDFVAWSLLSAHHFFDRSVTPAQAYRKGMEIIRRAIGNEKHINDCGPGPVSVGLIDSMRIEIDQNYGYSNAAWRQYFLESSSSAPAAAKRYYFHKKTWINDADHICINLLSTSQSEAAATLIALSGGNIISGDRLTDLDTIRIEILKKILPSFGEAALPVDLLDTDRHSIFAVKIKKPFGEWTVVGFFNSSENEPIEKTISLSRLWLDPKKVYLGFDFWKQNFIGEVTNNLQVRILPASVTLLSLHERTGNPQFLSTDRHVIQGAHEMENLNWNPDAKTLSGTSLGILNSAQNITVYSPAELGWEQGRKVIFHDFDDYTLKIIDDHLIRVHVRFQKSEKIDWQINFNDSFN